MIAQALTAERLFEECGDVVRETATKFAHRHGQDPEEMVADASTAFMKGYAAIIGGKANSDDLRVEIRRWVWFELFDEYRTRTQHRRAVKTVIENHEFIGEVAADQPRPGQLVEFFDGLSPDAKQAALLAIDPPADVAATARAKGGTECNLRSTIRQHLRANGWAPDRITASFEEVAEALC